MKKALAIMVLTLACAFGSAAANAQNLYGEDLVSQLASPGEIRSATSIRAKLRKQAKTAKPLFLFVPLPFGDIDTAPDVSPTGASKRAKQWVIPPFQTIAPALSPDLPENIRRELEALDERAMLDTPEIWGAIPLDEPNVVPYSLRPAMVSPGEEIRVRVDEIPPPFSLRRYYDSDENIFVELAAYGGTTSLKAEEAFKAMKQSALKQEEMLGIGEQAFLTRIVVVDEASKPPVEAVAPVDGPAMPEPPPFPDLLPTDEARPELTDSGRAAALSAPAFTDLPVAGLEGKKVRYPSTAVAKKYVAKEGKVEQTLMVLVAYFPDQALTLSFAMEERMGNVQDLVAVAILAQRKLLEATVASKG